MNKLLNDYSLLIILDSEYNLKLVNLNSYKHFLINLINEYLNIKISFYYVEDAAAIKAIYDNHFNDLYTTLRAAILNGGVKSDL